MHEREKRVAAFTIRPLSPQQADAWMHMQAQFVDDPHGAVTRADSLLTEVMEVRGYPIVDFEQRSADLSVDHPEVVQNYRTAHDIALRHARGEADTEELRRAMIHYRALFDDLIHEPVDHRMVPNVSRIRQDDVRRSAGPVKFVPGLIGPRSDFEPDGIIWLEITENKRFPGLIPIQLEPE